MESLEKHEYDIAVSFAGENREYVEQVVRALQNYGVNVFYDKDKKVEKQGKDLFEYFPDVFINKAKYIVIFISEYYKEKVWTKHEFNSIKERILKSKEDIFLIKFDKTDLLGISKTKYYINANENTPIEVADILVRKIGINIDKRWFGKWEVQSTLPYFSGNLIINNVSVHKFDFEIIVVKGALVGNISGTAKIISDNEAEFVSQENFLNDEPSIIKFRKYNNKIIVEESNCGYYHGVGVSFDISDFVRKSDIFDDIKNLNDIKLSKIYSCCSDEEKYNNFLRCLYTIYDEKNLDDFEAEVIGSGVPGLYTICEAILMHTPDDEVYCAFIDDDSEILYFSSDKNFQTKKPKTIEKWIENLKDRIAK
ncbi:TIR domain-containing protein [Campylobacter sp. JMF_04 NA10]|uniref:TIR domain-containing protein n=1 Tax=Campylobacter sp. JMF_04 NA10 TaxID=2983824 RepID=UPI0022E9DE3D|nr:TIR domain-containing protein [Campylobacter sp. JMF_04 NA10]MDA3076804.1 TIR domain-containing protein [Campylobacter sp. JMF_04 NA10]